MIDSRSTMSMREIMAVAVPGYGWGFRRGLDRPALFSDDRDHYVHVYQGRLEIMGEGTKDHMHSASPAAVLAVLRVYGLLDY